MVDIPTWAQTVLTFIIGPLGALVLSLTVCYFLWKLFREEQKENRKNAATVETLASVTKKSVEEQIEWRHMVEALIYEPPKRKS